MASAALSSGGHTGKVEKNLQKRETGALKEKTQYVLTFGVIAAMLYVAQFPMLVIFFFGIFAYFLWKTFSRPSKQGIREVFEFYLSANEILRDDERRWFGFELQEVITRGEKILKAMNGAPPLVYYTLGALYHRNGNHKLAVDHLAYVVDNNQSDESTYLHPSGDLRNYVRVLRKIEREPSEAPQMSAAVRSLERSRKNKAYALLEESRQLLTESGGHEKKKPDLLSSDSDNTTERSSAFDREKESDRRLLDRSKPGNEKSREWKRSHSDSDDKDDIHSNRKPISEVLHDIYDKNIQ
ncbi:MAG: hypothetical protein OEM82_07945 [Acidobacteriota bacterium]|nr:hypothetical protein [Acidobacteriota bacterium]